ncbi:MAG: indolepyruvate ferredoxin oxidoreductase subunit beta, partial [Candidatus Lokiarchaeota archaeon]|nr:indolepyruvate ferredoxin oxidoreductase subunit beta [Candidatus Lokiarchaeota archaeon]MBD3202643.1 indolepyruvate ferredoxin oxidoreductase subunit beta [Candidatus Lokiarchaeota archaeon]
RVKSFNVLNVGVGGQGVISATQILAWSAMKQGYKVRTAETHGMAQRGGSVSSFTRFGTHVEGPLIPRGLTDIFLAFEASEALRYAEYVGHQTHIIINELFLYPHGIKNEENYPNIKSIEKYLQNITPDIYIINATKLAQEAGNFRTLNTVMIGFISGLEILPIDRDLLEENILEFVPPKAKDVNLKAFNLGIEKSFEMRGI